MAVGEFFAMVVGILLVGGIGFWAYRFMNKYRFLIKYKILRRSYNENDVRQLIQYLDAKMDAVGIESLILLDPKNTRTKMQIKELLYVFSELEKIERRGNK